MCTSNANNCIACSINVALLLKVLRAVHAHEAEALQVKLANRAVPGAATQDLVRPMLIFQWQGDSVGLGQEMPVGAPCTEHTDLARVKALCDVPTLCSFYLDIMPELGRITVSAN